MIYIQVIISNVREILDNYSLLSCKACVITKVLTTFKYSVCALYKVLIAAILTSLLTERFETSGKMFVANGPGLQGLFTLLY